MPIAFAFSWLHMFLFIFNPKCINFEFPAQNLNFWREKCVYLALVAAAAAFAVILVEAESLCFLMASYGLFVVDIDSSDWDLRIFSDEPTPILTGPVGCAPVPFGPPCKSLIDVISQVLIYVYVMYNNEIMELLFFTLIMFCLFVLKIHSFLKSCLRNLHFIKTWYFSWNLSISCSIQVQAFLDLCC